MNIRKQADYSEMFTALDAVMAAGLPQMKLYAAIGRLVCARPEKGAAVIAAVHQFGWTKTELMRQIEAGAHLRNSLDFADEVCYTG